MKKVLMSRFLFASGRQERRRDQGCGRLLLAALDGAPRHEPHAQAQHAPQSQGCEDTEPLCRRTVESIMIALMDAGSNFGLCSLILDGSFNGTCKLGIRHNCSQLRAEIRARATPAQSSTSTLSTTSGSPSSSSSRYEFVMYQCTG